MDVITKVADIDPVFREVAATLYPDVDARELYQLSKASPDTADVHAPGSGTPPKRSNKFKLGVGLAAGTAIEALAAKETIHPLVTDIKAASPAVKAAKTVGGKLGALRALGPGKGRLGSGTKAALMVGNLAVGIGASRELLKKPKQQPAIAKAAPAVEPELMTALEEILAARRRGEIDTTTALGLIDRVAPEGLEKGLGSAVKNGAKLARGVYPMGGGRLQRVAAVGRDLPAFKARRLQAHSDTVGYEWEKAINRGRKVAGAAVFTGTGLGAYHLRSKHLESKGLVKRDDTARVPAAGPDLEWQGEISKVNEDRRQVFGWCSLSTVNGQPVVDLQDDYVPIEEIEKSAYKYVISSRKGGDMHKRVGKGIYAQDEPLHTADLIESVIVTPDKLTAMGVPADAISKVHTGWWVGFQVNDDEQWRKVKDGERAGFSIHGTGTRTNSGAD